MIILWFPIGFFIIFIVLILTTQSRVQVFTNGNNGYQDIIVKIGFIHGFMSVNYIHTPAGKSIQIVIKNMILLNRTLKASEKEVTTSTRKTMKKPGKHQNWMNKFKDIKWSRCKDRLKIIITSFTDPQLTGTFKIGFDNPMYTGMLQGIYFFITAMLPQSGQKVTFEPVFINRCLKWEIGFSTLSRPFLLIWHSLFLWRNLRIEKK